MLKLFTYIIKCLFALFYFVRVFCQYIDWQKDLVFFNHVSLDCHLMIKESMEKLISSACKRFER